MNFVPSYEPLINSSVYVEAVNKCRGDQACLFDATLTGNIEIGLSTLMASEEAARVEQLSQAGKFLNLSFIP